MAYWGMARASGNRERAQAFLKKALAGRDAVTPARARVSGGLGAGRWPRRARPRQVPQGPRADRHRLPRRHRGQGALRRGVDVQRQPRRRGSAAEAGPGRLARSSGRASLPRALVGWPARRARARQLPPLQRAGAAHRPRAAHARPRLRGPRHVARSRHLARLGHARRDPLHGRDARVPVQHVELRPQPQLPQLRPGAVGTGRRRHPRRARAAGGSARPETQRRRALQPALAGRGGAHPRAGQVRALGRDPRRRLDPVGHVGARQGAARLGGDAGALRQGRRRRGAEARRRARRPEGRVRQARPRLAEVAVRDARRRARGARGAVERRRLQGARPAGRSRRPRAHAARRVRRPAGLPLRPLHGTRQGVHSRSRARRWPCARSRRRCPWFPTTRSR